MDRFRNLILALGLAILIPVMLACTKTAPNLASTPAPTSPQAPVAEKAPPTTPASASGEASPPSLQTPADDDGLDLGRHLTSAQEPPSETEGAEPTSRAGREPRYRFSPDSAAPGEWVTLSGKARANSFMSFYFYCDSWCGETHVKVANVAADGSYEHKFQIPSGARSGGAYLLGGCDRCGNGWSRFSGLKIAPKPLASPDRLRLIDQSYRRAFGRPPTADETKYWASFPNGDPHVASLTALVTTHLQYLKQNAETTFGADVAQRAFKEATGEDISLAPQYDGAIKEIKANAPAFSDLVWHIRVDVALRTVYGRAPTDAELRLWKSMFGVISDEEDAILKAWNINKIVASLRKDLREKADTPLGREIVTLAFKAARGRNPDASELNLWVGEMVKGSLIYPDLVIRIGEIGRISFTSFDSIDAAISSGKLSEAVYIDAVKRGQVPPSVQWAIAQRRSWRYDPPAPALSLVNPFVRSYLANAGYDIDHLPDFIILGLNQGNLPAHDPNGLSLDNMGNVIRPAPAPQPISYSSPESVSQAISEGRISPQEFADLAIKNEIPQGVLAMVAIRNEVFLSNVTPLLPTDIYLTQVTPLVRPDQLNNATPLWVRLDLAANSGGALAGDNSLGVVKNVSIATVTTTSPLILDTNPLGNAFTMPIGNNLVAITGASLTATTGGHFSVQSVYGSAASRRMNRLPPGFFRAPNKT